MGIALTIFCGDWWQTGQCKLILKRKRSWAICRGWMLQPSPPCHDLAMLPYTPAVNRLSLGHLLSRFPKAPTQVTV